MTKAEIKQQVERLWDTVRNVGTSATIPAAILFLLDFRAVRQGFTIGKDVAKTGWEWGNAEVQNIFNRILLWFGLTALFGLMTYWIGTDTGLFGSLFLYLFAISLIVFQMYPFTIALAAAIAYKWYKDSPTDAVGDIWKLYVHILFWDCMFLLANILFRPWEPGRLELFIVLLLSEAAWFLVTPKTRTAVRGAAITVAGITGAVAFGVLLFLALDSYSSTKPIAQWGKNLVVATGSVIGSTLDGLVDYADHRADWNVLTSHERIVDMNDDGKLNEADVAVYGRIIKGTIPVRTVSVDSKIFKLGDFDGDNDVDAQDSIGYDLWNNDQGPGPAKLTERIAFLYPAKYADEDDDLPPIEDPTDTMKAVDPQRAVPDIGARDVGNQSLASADARDGHWSTLLPIDAQEMGRGRSCYRATVTDIYFPPENDSVMVLSVEFYDPAKNPTYIGFGNRTLIAVSVVNYLGREQWVKFGVDEVSMNQMGRLNLFTSVKPNHQERTLVPGVPISATYVIHDARLPMLKQQPVLAMNVFLRDHRGRELQGSSKANRAFSRL